MFSFLAATLFGTAAAAGSGRQHARATFWLQLSRRLAASRVNHFPHFVVLLLLMPCAPAASHAHLAPDDSWHRCVLGI